MKKLLLFLGLLAAATALVGYFKPEWLPFLARERLDPQSREEVPLALPPSQPVGPPMYRWIDADGRTNLSDQPPKDRPYETLRYHPDTNVIPAPMPSPDTQ